MTIHQQKQKKVIQGIEEQIQNNSINFSTVAPVENYETDIRMCLTSVHFPKPELVKTIQETIIAPLKAIEPSYYYYGSDSLHMTIKNIRVINDPPDFTQKDIEKAENIFASVLPKHKQFTVYFYRLLLFPTNIALIGTTDEELDRIILDVDQALLQAGVPDNKQYSNNTYFFSNMTLARFPFASKQFREKVETLSQSLAFKPYTVDSVTLLTCNAVFKKRTVVKMWQLE